MRFSIITVTRNNLAGLRTTHASIAAQTFHDFEWIVVDAASTDGTAQQMQEWNNAAYFISEPDSGPYDAMNKGAAVAGGEYLIFMNAGDSLAAPDTLARINSAAGADFIYGDSLEQQQSGQVFYKKARHHSIRWWGMFTHHQAMIFRRHALAPLSLLYNFMRFPVGADMDLVWRLLRLRPSVQKLDFAICHFAAAGMSAARAAEGRGEQMIMRKEYMRFCPALVNALILLGQKTVWAIKQRRPEFYEGLRLNKSIKP